MYTYVNQVNFNLRVFELNFQTHLLFLNVLHRHMQPVSFNVFTMRVFGEV